MSANKNHKSSRASTRIILLFAIIIYHKLRAVNELIEQGEMTGDAAARQTIYDEAPAVFLILPEEVEALLAETKHEHHTAVISPALSATRQLTRTTRFCL